MAENQTVIEHKQRKLSYELAKPCRDEKVIRRLKESIKRHKQVGKRIRHAIKNKPKRKR